MVEAGLGLGPWEALNQGIARQLGLEIGTVSILLGIPILALWWPLGERPGIGTVLNVVLIGHLDERRPSRSCRHRRTTPWPCASR